MGDTPRWGYSFRSRNFGAGRTPRRVADTSGILAKPSRPPRPSPPTPPTEPPRPQPETPAGEPGDESPTQECGAGHWCIAATSRLLDDGKIERVPAQGYRQVCDRCEATVAEHLGIDAHDKVPRFAKLYWYLTRELGVASSDSLGIRVPFGPSIPLRGDVDELMRRMVLVLVSWHARVAEIAHLSPPDWDHAAAEPLRAVADASDRLREHLPVLIALADGPMRRVNGDHLETVSLGGGAAAGEILRLRANCRRVLGETGRPEKLLGVRCYQCHAKTLVRSDPPRSDHELLFYSRCTECGHKMTDVEYARHLKRLLATARGRVETPRLEGQLVIPGSPLITVPHLGRNCLVS